MSQQRPTPKSKTQKNQIQNCFCVFEFNAPPAPNNLTLPSTTSRQEQCVCNHIALTCTYHTKNMGGLCSSASSLQLREQAEIIDEQTEIIETMIEVEVRLIVYCLCCGNLFLVYLILFLFRCVPSYRVGGR